MNIAVAIKNKTVKAIPFMFLLLFPYLHYTLTSRRFYYDNQNETKDLLFDVRCKKDDPSFNECIFLKAIPCSWRLLCLTIFFKALTRNNESTKGYIWRNEVDNAGCFDVKIY